MYAKPNYPKIPPNNTKLGVVILIAAYIITRKW